MKHDTTKKTSDNEDHDCCDDTANTGKEPNKDSTYDKVPTSYSGTVYTCPMHPEVRDVEDSGCPICKMSLKPEDTVAEMVEMEGDHASCHSHNDSTANTDEKSVKGGKHDKVPAGYSGTIYICPMHSEVRDVEDSGCPICKMSLKPEDTVAEMEDNHASCHSHNDSASNKDIKSVKGGKYDLVPAGCTII